MGDLPAALLRVDGASEDRGERGEAGGPQAPARHPAELRSARMSCTGALPSNTRAEAGR